MASVLKMAEAAGYNVQIMAELMPAIEAGFVAARNERIARGLEDKND